MTETPVEQIEGASELAAWFGSFPRLHDANVVEFELSGEGNGHLTAKAFRMTDKIDDKGFFVLEKHCLVTLHFNEITTVELQDFQPGQAILSDVDITKATSAFRIEIGSSYGFSGTIVARKLSVSFEPTGDAI